MTKCKLVKERMELKESETEGKWMTEEAMKKSGKYSSQSIKNITGYCRKFPESLVRPAHGVHGIVLGTPIYLERIITLYIYIYICIYAYICIYMYMRIHR